MEDDSRDDALDSISALSDPARRRLYDYVSSRDTPVGREEAATATGMSRTLAAYHLDRLAEAGLLETGYSREPGRQGPGDGRPAKRYVRSERETTVSVPERDYRLLAGLLTDAVAVDGSGRLLASLTAAAEERGRAGSAPTVPLVQELRDRGYEPTEGTQGADAGITLRNCPFHRLARQHPDVVCGINHALIRGVLEGRDDDPDRAELVPPDGRCCVFIRPAP